MKKKITDFVNENLKIFQYNLVCAFAHLVSLYTWIRIKKNDQDFIL